MMTVEVPKAGNFERALCIGVLGLQGAFIEHVNILQRTFPGAIETRVIQSSADLDSPLDALILPGGESTSMSVMARRFGLLEGLRNWVSSGRPIMGTCAGLILLGNDVVGAQDGQDFIGGLDCRVHRNFYGAQTESFIAPINIVDPALGRRVRDEQKGVFIRAPLIESIDPQKVKVLATLERDSWTQIIAVQQGNILALSFHPELTESPFWHEYFAQIVREHVEMEENDRKLNSYELNQ